MSTKTIERYPLQWPQGWPRTPRHQRKRAAFSKSARGTQFSYRAELSIADGVTRALKELHMMGVPDFQVAISSNAKVRLDGLPLSNQAEPDDPGVAIYWMDGQNMRAMASDRYDRVADNLAALAATFEAMRAIERHGGAQILDRAFIGFAALPPPGGSSRTWRDVLGFGRDELVNANDIKTAFRRLANERHPDKQDGTVDAMSELNVAREQALREVGA